MEEVDGEATTVTNVQRKTEGRNISSKFSKLSGFFGKSKGRSSQSASGPAQSTDNTVAIFFLCDLFVHRRGHVSTMSFADFMTMLGLAATERSGAASCGVTGSFSSSLFSSSLSSSSFTSSSSGVDKSSSAAT